jgi:ATP-dependent exoDNAse (exonuclease V) beta subunit
MNDPSLADANARNVVRTQLDETLFVEAGAGTGKTTVLVERIVELVTVDGPGLPVSMRDVAAITFTEKAAAELRDRVRGELERRARAADTSPAVAGICTDALEQLDDAAICTLHAFAQRILTAFPVEAGLPPRIEVQDEVSSLLAFDARWRRTRDDLLDDRDLEPAVLVALAAGATPEHFRRVAERLDDNWDLLDRIGPGRELPALDLGPWFADLDAVCAARADCTDGDDKLLAQICSLDDYRARLRAAVDDAELVELLLAKDPSFASRRGLRTNWPDVDGLRSAIKALGEQRPTIVAPVIDAALRLVVSFLAQRSAEHAAERRRAGTLEFHDLLVLARTVLRDPHHGAGVRARLRDRYQRLLVDEFQDTDPIQVEIAVLLAANDGQDPTDDWRTIDITPGRVFFVGDPKQSIYRFRRADITTFLDARTRFADQPIQLTSNFRSTEPVLDWINVVFGALIEPEAGSQPEYFALDPTRPAAPNGPGVLLLGVDPLEPDLSADQAREHEAASVAAAVRAAVEQRWQVNDGNRGWRDARLGDVCILLPARTSLYLLERALDDAGISYRAETSSLVYGTREVRDLLASLRAVDDPSDELALVSALRSSVFGCGDDDLFDYHVEHGGWWDIRLTPPDSLPGGHPVVDAMRYLGALHTARTWVTPSALLERIVRERHLFEVGADSGRFRDIARRVRFIVDQARAFGDAAGGSLRDYLAWATLQGTEGARVVETVLPETDDDAVRIMTIHGAKGLEFPIVICSGTTTRPNTNRGGVQLFFPPTGSYEVRLNKHAQTDAFELYQAIDEQMSLHEKLRLLYVACTRASDHLVVSVHRTDRARPDDNAKCTAAELLWYAALQAHADIDQPSPAPRLTPPKLSAPAPPALDTWLAAHDRAFATGARRRFVSATALAQLDDHSAAVDPGVAKEGRDLELPPWNKGRYGTAIGRAVHAVLQTVDLATGAGLADLAAAQAAAEGVVGSESTITALAQSALNSSTVRVARVAPHWRETYVAVPIDGLTLEGYVDLIYRDGTAPDGDALVVVDYKTDAIGDAAQLTERMSHYQVQGAAYAVAVAAATGERVDRCVFVFLTPDGAHEVEIAGDELVAAVTRVTALIRRFRDDPPPYGAAVLADA